MTAVIVTPAKAGVQCIEATSLLDAGFLRHDSGELLLGMPHNIFNSLREFKLASGKNGKMYSLAALEAAGPGRISRMPRSLRIALESLLRNCDGKRVTEEHVRNLAAWRADGARTAEIPMIVVRILLQDMIGFPSLNDLTVMRAAAERLGARSAAHRAAGAGGRRGGSLGNPVNPVYLIFRAGFTGLRDAFS